MASSQPSLDLNLYPSGQSTEVAPVWQPTFRTSLGPITINDSVLRSPATALGVANNMLMPRDQLMLASRPDIVAADESQCWSIQASASVTNLCHRLRARVQENDSLKVQVAVLQKMLQEANTKINNLKQENTNLAKLVSNYEKEMRVKLQELEASRDQLSEVQKRMEEEQRKIASDVQRVIDSHP
jgi:hypothetical protein